jgi:excinuclease UvrABC nuclease subunit
VLCIKIKKKKEIYKENRDKTGVYELIKLKKKCYVGSAVNLLRRFKYYFNKSYLIMEVKKSNY